jgi:hypothetical protein
MMEWPAVRVGVLKFDFVDEETTPRWISDDCPVPGEQSEQRLERTE